MLGATCRALRDNLKEIVPLDDDGIMIPNNRILAAITLPKYFGQLNGANWSLWMRDKTPRAQPNHPATQNIVQEQPETAGVAVINGPGPPAQPHLEARLHELENQLRTTNSGLAAIRSRLPSEKEPLASVGRGPSPSVPEPRPMVPHDPYQMNQADGSGLWQHSRRVSTQAAD
ncbi:hypothetical protein FRC00_005434 [Tulasnella sp. 408]|nr:hypothetical protein FRC00_005434 [Tulasnella sp. 408]